MDDALLVRVLEPPRRLDQAVEGLGNRHRAALADDAIEVAPFDVVHHQEVHAAVLVGVEGGDEVGMFQPSGGRDFAPEAQDGRAVAGRRGGQDLQRDDPAELAVAGLEDHAHATGPQLVEDQVVADQQAPALARETAAA